jgi:hypothetical protein
LTRKIPEPQRGEIIMDLIDKKIFEILAGIAG